MKQPRRWFIFSVVVVAVGSIVLGTRLTELVSPHEAVAVVAAPPSAAATLREGAQQPFDYFPDHYVNQAKEASQPIDQF